MGRSTAVGLDIGTSGVRAAELGFGRQQARLALPGQRSRRPGQPARPASPRVSLSRFGQVALPDGAVRDGEVVDPPVVAAAIRHLWAQAGISSKKVGIGVASARVLVRQVDLPWLPPQELRASLALQVADLLPMPVEEALLDFHPLEELRGDGNRQVRGLLVAASRQTVTSSVEAVSLAGLTPTSVDLTPFAVLRARAHRSAQPPPSAGGAGPDRGGAEALVDVGARVTNVVVHEDGVPRFVRILLTGGQDVTDAVAERMGLPTPDAEALKQELGILAPAAFPRQGPSSERETAGRVVETHLDGFVAQIRSSLSYYLSSSGSAPVSEVVLTGGGGRLAGLSARLEAATRLPVRVGAPLTALDQGDTGLTPEQLAFADPLSAVPVGLALGLVA